MDPPGPNGQFRKARAPDVRAPRRRNTRCGQEPLQERKGERKTTIALTVGDSSTTRGLIPDSAADCAAGSSPLSTPSEAAVRGAPLRHVFTAGCFSGAALTKGKGSPLPSSRKTRRRPQGPISADSLLVSAGTRPKGSASSSFPGRRRTLCVRRVRSPNTVARVPAKADVISRSRFAALPAGLYDVHAKQRPEDFASMQFV